MPALREGHKRGISSPTPREESEQVQNYRTAALGSEGQDTPSKGTGQKNKSHLGYQLHQSPGLLYYLSGHLAIGRVLHPLSSHLFRLPTPMLGTVNQSSTELDF